MFREGFEKFQHILGNLETHIKVQGYTQAQERPEMARISRLWLTLGLCVSKK